MNIVDIDVLREQRKVASNMSKLNPQFCMNVPQHSE